MTDAAGIFAPAALLPDGWQRSVAIRWDGNGLLTSLEPDATPGSLPVAAGPVVPGMPNAHSHAFQRVLAGRVQAPEPEADFWAWRTLMYRAVAALTPASLEELCAWVFAEMVTAGYTSVLEFHYVHRVGGAAPEESAQAMLRAARRSGIAVTLAPVLYRHGGIGRPLSAEQSPFGMERAEYGALIRGLRAAGHHVAVAPHSVRACNRDDIEAVLDAAGDAPIHIHVSEQPAEVAEARRHLGATPIAWLDREFGLSPRWGLVHATQATPEELALLDARKAGLVLCPTTEHDLGDGRYALERTPRAAWTIGSDSQLSVAPGEELRLILAGLRAAAGRRAVLPPSDFSDGTALWQRAALSAEPLLGQPVGALAEGSRADFLVIDAAAPLFAGLTPDEALSAWVLSGSPSHLSEVRVGGRVKARAGRHVNHETLAGGWIRTVRDILN